MFTISNTGQAHCSTVRKNNVYLQKSITAAAIQVFNIVDTNEATTNMGGKSGGPAIHRSCFGRKTLRHAYQKIGNIDRYYYKDEEEFQRDLERFNRSIINKKKSSLITNGERCFAGVGLANVRLKFCSKCFDVDKDNEMELYYVNKGDISQHRTTLCRGCIGNELQQYKKERGSTETLV